MAEQKVRFFREYKPGRPKTEKYSNKSYVKFYPTHEAAKQDQNQRLLPEIHESKILT